MFLKIVNIREEDYPWVLILLLQMIQEYMFAGWMNFGVTEVRSKILTPLEITGGNLISLEGFEKLLFTG